MKVVRTALCYIIHDRTRCASVFNAKVVCDHGHLVQSVWIPHENRGAADGIIVVRLTVNLEVIGTAAQSIRREARSIRVAEVVVTGIRNTRNKESQSVEAPAQ